MAEFQILLNHETIVAFGIGHTSCVITVLLRQSRVSELKLFTGPTQKRGRFFGRMKAKFDFFSCVGMGGGTLFPLACQPIIPDVPDYFGRKFKYSVTCFILNDDQKCIRAYSADWTGSVR